MCRQAGIVRLIINGSFVTDRRDPQDVDCVLLTGEDYDSRSNPAGLIRAGLPYLSLELAEDQEDFDFFVKEVFGSDRHGVIKGMIEVAL